MQRADKAVRAPDRGQNAAVGPWWTNAPGVYALVCRLLYDVLLARRACGRVFRFLNREELDIKTKGGVGRNVWRITSFAVAKVRRDDELPFRSDRHHLQRLDPAFDDAVH